MNVTIIGAGNMGRGIGHRLVAGGHDVTVVDRDPEDAGRLAEELRGAAQGGATVEAAGRGAELRGEVVILAVYYPGTLELARELGERLAGKVVVDIANPLNETFAGLATAPGTSAAEEVANNRTGRHEGRQGVQHHLLRDPRSRPGRGSAARCAHRRGRRGDQGDGGATRARRGPACHRRRSVGAREAAGGPRVPRDHAAAAAGFELPSAWKLIS